MLEFNRGGPCAAIKHHQHQNRFLIVITSFLSEPTSATGLNYGFVNEPALLLSPRSAHL
jgi:hypothetical protein